MKRLKGLILISMGLLYPITTLFAQSYAEGALMISRTYQGGTARVQGMGGAQMALGGDPSVAGSNPAGLGMSNRSSVSITGNLFNENVNSIYYNNRSTSMASNFNLPQAGAIFFRPSADKEEGFQGGAFSVNYTMADNYHHKGRYETQNPDESIIDYMLYAVDGLSPYEFGETGSETNSLLGLGWYTYLIDTIDGFYDSYILDYPTIQGEETFNRGRQGRWDFSYGGNFADKVFFGGGISISRFKYFSEKRYSESFSSNMISGIEVDENLHIDGAGFSAVVGVIGRPLDFLQIGVSYRTPTLYNVNDEYDAKVTAYWNGFNYSDTEVLNTIEDQTAILYSDYSIRAPGKLSLGIAGFFGKQGFVTADFERTDYRAVRLDSRDINFQDDNDLFSTQQQVAYNFRIGGEFRYKIFRFRAGGALYGDPNKSSSLVDSSVRQVTFGAGLKKEAFSVDFALVNNSFETAYFPYLINGEGHLVESKTNQMNSMVTVGFSF